MIRILLLIIIVTFGAYGQTAGQNYRNICTSGLTFFRNNDGYFGVFRQDSAIATGNGDTTFISYRTIRGNDDCKDTSNGSTLGRKIIATSTGMFLFFNANNDTIIINTQAITGQTWRFCSIGGGNYLEANVNSIVPGQVLNQPDNIKTISLQAKNSSGTNINHPLNGKIIELSQHYGLTRMLEVYSIPSDTGSWFLVGKSNPMLGIQDITWQEIYDYQIGDEFHYHNTFANRIERVLERINYGNDSVRYTFERCEKSLDIWNYYTFHDTLTCLYKYNDPAGSWLTFQPEEFIRTNIDAMSLNFSNNIFLSRKTKEITDPAYVFDSSTECWSRTYYFYMTNQFSQGLGKTKYVWHQTDPMANFQEELVYYKKQDETWGTPVATDCSTLVPVYDRKMVKISISPNPVISMAEITINDSDTFNYRLINFSGSVIRKGIIENGKMEFNRAGLNAGIYFLIISDEAKVVGKMKVVLE